MPGGFRPLPNRDLSPRERRRKQLGPPLVDGWFVACALVAAVIAIVVWKVWVT